VDFEGVSGSALGLKNPEEKPSILPFLNSNIKEKIKAFEVYAKAVVTSRDLFREVATQSVSLKFDEEGRPVVTGKLINNGTIEATIPHIFITYYDKDGKVVWVDHHYMEVSIRPQRVETFNLPLLSVGGVRSILEKGGLYSNDLAADFNPSNLPDERIKVPENLGYSFIRLSVSYYAAGGQ
jgi:hypothetical protein